jgi:hypothetical protein
MADTDINFGYPNLITKGRTVIMDKEDLTFYAKGLVSYNDGGAQTEDSNWTEPSEREYVIPPDRKLNLFPVKEMGNGLIVTTGEVTVYEQKIVCADAAFDHFDRVAFRIAPSHCGAMQELVVYPMPYDYIVDVYDGSAHRYYMVSKLKGPVLVDLSDEFEGENSTKAKYIEFILFDTDLELTEGFSLDAANKTLYYLWPKTPVQILVNVYNSIDTGLYGAMAFITDIGLTNMYKVIVDNLISNQLYDQLASTVGQAVMPFVTSIAQGLTLAVYWKHTTLKNLVESDIMTRVLAASMNPMAIVSTTTAILSGYYGNKYINLASQVAGGATAALQLQAILQVLDDVALNIYF